MKNRAEKLLSRVRMAAIPAALLLAFQVRAHAADTDVVNLADVPFEQLLQTEVITANKLARQISDAPSAVSIVTAQDIKDFGYRTLGDILNGMRGLNVVQNGAYGFLAGRGYSGPSDFAGMITLLIDGYRAPDNLWGQIYFGNDGILDVELIDRVEYIPGSGSSSYGDSAFLGVINIVTKKGGDIGGLEVSTEAGSHGWQRARAAYGQKFDSGVDLLVSVSRLQTAGRFQAAEYGLEGFLVEKDRNQRYFLKVSYGGWSFEAAQAERSNYDGWIDWPTGRMSDENRFASLKYDAELGADLKTSSHLYFGHYRYRQYDPNGWRSSNSGGDWWGLDSKLVGTWFNRHTLVLGGEYRNDFLQRSWNQADPSSLVDEVRTDRETFSLYAYDDVALSEQIKLTLGGRSDRRENGNSTFSPRSALVVSPWTGTTLKYSSGISHRQPTGSSDLSGIYSPVQRLYSNEVVWEQMLGAKTRWINSIYRYRITDFATWIDHFEPVTAKGFETELEHLWASGVRLRTSYTWQQASIGNQLTMLNMAKNIVKFNLSAPLYGERLRAGVAVRYLGPRANGDTYSSSTLLSDLTLNSRWNHWFASFSVRNLGNVSYSEVPGDWYGADRRNYWLQIGYEFK